MEFIKANKKDFIAAMAELNGMTKKAAGEAVDAFLLTLEHLTAQRKEVNLNGYLATELKVVEAYVGRNPKTGESVNVPEKIKVKASAKAKLKRAAETGEISGSTEDAE